MQDNAVVVNHRMTNKELICIKWVFPCHEIISLTYSLTVEKLFGIWLHVP